MGERERRRRRRRPSDMRSKSTLGYGPAKSLWKPRKYTQAAGLGGCSRRHWVALASGVYRGV